MASKRRIPIELGFHHHDQMEQLGSRPDRLMYLTLRIRRAEMARDEATGEIAKFSAERDRVIEEIASVYDPDGDAEFEEYEFEDEGSVSDAEGVIPRSSETTERANAIVEFIR